MFINTNYISLFFHRELKCDNIVQLIGVVVDPKLVCFVMELMEKGDLKSYVTKNHLTDEVSSSY